METNNSPRHLARPTHGSVAQFQQILNLPQQAPPSKTARGWFAETRKFNSIYYTLWCNLCVGLLKQEKWNIYTTLYGVTFTLVWSDKNSVDTFQFYVVHNSVWVLNRFALTHHTSPESNFVITQTIIIQKWMRWFAWPSTFLERQIKCYSIHLQLSRLDSIHRNYTRFYLQNKKQRYTFPLIQDTQATTAKFVPPYHQ